MPKVTMELSDELALALRLEPEALEEELRLAAAAKLYELGRLSSGAAAQLAGIPKPLFLTRLCSYGIPTFMNTEEELRQDVANA